MEFKNKLLRRFHSSQPKGGYDRLFTTKKEKLMLEFVEKFELSFAQVKDAFEKQLIGPFCKGLKAEIRTELKISKTTMLRELMEMPLSSVDRMQGG